MLLSFMTGIGAGKALTILPVWSGLWICTGTALLVLSLVYKKPRIYPLMIVAAGMGSLWIHGAGHPHLPANHISRYATGEPLIITGTAAGNPRITERRTRIILCTEYIDQDGNHLPVTGKIRVTVMGRLEAVTSGQHLTIRGRLRPFRNFGNPGAFDYREYMTFQGIWASTYASAENVRILESPPNPHFVHRINRVRRHIDRAIADHEGDAHARAVLQALLTGNRQSITPELQDMFNRAGAGHLLAISGLHMGIVATVSFMVFRWLLSFFPALLWRAWTRKGAACLTVLPVLGYGLISGMSPSTQRAMIMVFVFLLSITAERDHDILNTLAVAAIIILICSPQAMFSISFQMSFMAVLWIILGLQAISGFTTKHPRQSPRSFLQKIAIFVMVSFFAILGTLPLTMAYFNQVSLTGLVANLILIPLVGFLAVPLGILALCVMPLFPVLSDHLIGLDLIVVNFSLGIIHRIGALPYSLFTTITPDRTLILCYYVILFALLFWIYHRNCGTTGIPRSDLSLISPKANRVLLFTALFILFSHTAFLIRDRYATPYLSLTAIDVGQGSATLVRFPKGKTMLVDGGGFSDNSVFDVGRHILAPFLLRNHIKTLDMVVLTHPEADHVNGLTYILKHFTVKTLITTGESKDTYGYRKFQQTIQREDIPVRPFPDVNRHRIVNGVHMDILSPPATISSPAATGSWWNTNNTSIVIRLTYKDISFLLPGDIMAQAEKALVETRGATLHSTVLFVPHHGSRTSSSPSFLRAVAPDIAVISLGWQNRFHFPSRQVIRRLDKLGAQIYRTDIHGAIQMLTNGKTIHVHPYHPAPEHDISQNIESIHTATY